MKIDKKVAIVVTLALIVILVSIKFWFDTSSNSHTLKSIEVREYQGQKLSSISDFRENSIKGPQNVSIEIYRLVINGLVERNATYTYDEVIKKHKIYEKVVTLHCVEGWDVTILWEGVLVNDLLEEAGIDPRTKVVIFYAIDGYSTSLPLDYIIGNNILLANKMNGVTLPSERGFPFQLVAESKWGYKWIKWINRIELTDNINYKGYWESVGYSNYADFENP